MDSDHNWVKHDVKCGRKFTTMVCKGNGAAGSKSRIFFFKLINLFIFGRVGSSFLCEGFL